MKITAVITDADIRWHIDQAATELEEDNQIRFPDSTARAEFIEDCVSSEICWENLRVRTFAEEGVLTYNKGLVISLPDGTEFQLTIVQSR